MENKYKELLVTLEKRFLENPSRHNNVSWEYVKSILVNNNEYLEAILKMDKTGGEPDVIGDIDVTGFITVVDCSIETPKGRRSVCYDNEALNNRKDNKPKNSAVEFAKEIGIEILDEDQYRELQNFGCFDEKTSSWIKTPEQIRIKGGALFCDRRYNHVFTYHNGAESYYAVRGFRGFIKIK
jgi:hypothetical protein